MSTQLYDCIDTGFATRILSSEAGTTCLGCNNLFSEKDKVYMMNKKNGTTIMCSSLDCFEKQGGRIDEYQITTIVARKSKVIIPNVQPQNKDFTAKVIAQYNRINQIETILLQNYPSEFKDVSQRAKLGMYMKMIDDNIKDDV